MMFEKVQIKYDGELRDFNLADLELGDSENPSDGDLRQAVCVALNIDSLNEFIVDRGDTIINLRPPNVWG